MLDPYTRHIYTEQLEPPEGYTLDKVLATTYSLDLLSLLMAPISMVFQDYRIQNTLINDPVAMMESLNRIADKFLVFCQNGRISIPTQDTLLYGLLEKIGIFSPHCWQILFVRFIICIE